MPNHLINGILFLVIRKKLERHILYLLAYLCLFGMAKLVHNERGLWLVPFKWSEVCNLLQSTYMKHLGIYFSKVVLWRKSHLSYLSHFETKTTRLHEQKNAVYCFQISLFVPEIFNFFKICKLAKWWCHTLKKILFKYDKKRYLSQFVSEMFDTLQ